MARPGAPQRAARFALLSPEIRGRSLGREVEVVVTSGKSPGAARISKKTSLRILVNLHIEDMAEVGKSPCCSKAEALEKLKRDLGDVALKDLTRERLIAFGKGQAKEGAGPVTVGMDLGDIRTVLVHATAIHGIETPTYAVMMARTALRRLGLVGKGDSSRPIPWCKFERW